jgi:hypothetical protein
MMVFANQMRGMSLDRSPHVILTTNGTGFEGADAAAGFVAPG